MYNAIDRSATDQPKSVTTVLRVDDLIQSGSEGMFTTFVFCSAPDPIQGLRELGRVVKPDGQILLLEHVRIDRPVVGQLMDLFSPLTVASGRQYQPPDSGECAAGRVCDREHQNLEPIGMVKSIAARPGPFVTNQA